MQKYCLWLIALFLIGTCVPAHAEALDDDTIRQIYAEMKAAIRDPVKTRQLMETRLDDKYVLKSDVTNSVDGSQPQKLSQSRTKAQAIDDTVKSMATMKMDTYESNIVSIQYSGDKKFAYVKDASTSAGTVSIPAQGGQFDTLKYDAKESCSHIMTLVDAQIKIMQSQCDDQIAFKK